MVELWNEPQSIEASGHLKKTTKKRNEMTLSWVYSVIKQTLNSIIEMRCRDEGLEVDRIVDGEFFHFTIEIL